MKFVDTLILFLRIVIITIINLSKAVPHVELKHSHTLSKLLRDRLESSDPLASAS